MDIPAIKFSLHIPLWHL